jgi:hypothetical protein
MAQNADPLLGVVASLLAGGSAPDSAPSAPSILDCRSALLAPSETKYLPTWQSLPALLEACRDDPARFQAEVLGRTLWSRQVAVCAAVAKRPITGASAGSTGRPAGDRRRGQRDLRADRVRDPRSGCGAGREVAGAGGADRLRHGGHRPFVRLLSVRPRPQGRVGFGAGRGGRRYVNRRTANAFALRRRLDPHRDDFIPFYCGGIPEWPTLRQELAELHAPAMEIQESETRQLLEPKKTLTARLHRSPDLLHAHLMTFTYRVELAFLRLQHGERFGQRRDPPTMPIFHEDSNHAPAG